MKSNKTITIIASLLLILTLTACTEERPPIIINNPTDSSLFVLKSGDTMTGALIVNNTFQVKNGFPNEGVSIIGGDLWATGSIFLLGNLTAVNINTITLNDTDSIRAGSSSGLLIEANNGVDVAYLGSGNTANTLFYGTIIAPSFQGNLTSTNATITTLDITGSLTSGETRINNRGNINTNSSLNLLVTGLANGATFNVSHNIFVNHTGLPTPTAGRSVALMGQYVLSPNNAMTAHVSGFNEFTTIIPNSYTTVSTIGTLRTNSVYAINDATSSTAGTVNGLYSSAQMTGEGSIGRLSGFEPNLLVSSTGNVTNALGILQSMSHTGSGVVTNYRGMWINTLTNSGGGTITNTYGIYMGDLTSGTQTNQAYNIYLEDVNARNYIGGNTTLNGTVNVTNTLSASTINAQSSLQVNGANINTGGTLSNVAYLNTANTFVQKQTVTGSLSGQNIVQFENTNANGYGPYITGGSAGGAYYSIYVADRLGNLQFYAQNGGLYVPNLRVSENLTVDTNTLFVDSSNNNVGIGTTSPAYKLDVSREIQVNKDGVITSGFYNGVVMGGWDLFGYDSTANYVVMGGYRASQWHGVQFYGNGVERMRINNGGNVGINTSSPSEVLDIDGNLNFGIVGTGLRSDATFTITNGSNYNITGEGFFLIMRNGAPATEYAYGVREANGATILFNNAGFNTTQNAPGTINLFTQTSSPYGLTVQNYAGNSKTLKFLWLFRS